MHTKHALSAHTGPLEFCDDQAIASREHLNQASVDFKIIWRDNHGLFINQQSLPGYAMSAVRDKLIVIC